MKLNAWIWITKVYLHNILISYLNIVMFFINFSFVLITKNNWSKRGDEDRWRHEGIAC